MAARLITVADAVAALLDTTVTTAGGMISREYTPATKLESLKNLLVVVVPRGEVRSRAARGAIQSDYTVDVTVQKRTPGGKADADAVTLTVEELADYLESNNLPANVGASFHAAVTDLPFDEGNQFNAALFTATIRAVYRGVRAI